MRAVALLPLTLALGPLVPGAAALPLASAATASATPELDRATVPAAGRQRALVTVGRFGRYAVQVQSAQGVALQVVDRMAGPRDRAGRAGEADGRLDLFLERGEYRLLTEGHPRATGEARLAIREFDELSGPQPPMLVETKLVESSLDDFQQRSYWLVVKERRRVALEAAGRNLADLRLWREGQWLVDATPQLERVQPRLGRPLLAARVFLELEPGLYHVTAYGGPDQPWAEEGEEHPFYLRFGLPRLPEAGRRKLSVSPFGIDRFLVPGAATYFRLELPEARTATLRAATFDPDQPFAPPAEMREVTKKSLPPVAELDLPASEDAEPAKQAPPDRIVTVEGEAGQGYVLQQFDRRHAYFFRADGSYWLSTIHSGHPQDSVDVTALLLAGNAKAPLRDEVVALGAQASWKRRANLLEPLTVFFRVKDAGRYEILLEGPEARARIEPFLTYRPERYKSPPFRGSGSTWDLDPGFYVLTAEPVKRGIVTFTVRFKGLVDQALGAVGVARATSEAPVRAAAVFPKVDLDRDLSYAVYLNEQPDVRSGVQLRKLPLDPTEPLFVSQRPGETLSVAVRVNEPGQLRAETEDGTPVEVSVDGAAGGKAPAMAPGTHTVTLRHDGPDTVQYTLAFEPALLASTAELPPLPAEEAPVAFPTLAEGTPRFLDLPAGGSTTFGVRADQAGLYVLESTGLLATEGNLRSRVVTSFARESGNGTGRNFELREYLREGDYQLTVEAQAPSAGRLGVQLRRTRVEDGGDLRLRLPARATLRAGEAVSYRFTITTPGEFRVRTLGLSRSLRCRLEDKDGWPLVPPGGPADITRTFEPGLYRFVVLPETTDARAVTVIEPMGPRRMREGHGPHPLPLGQTVEHVWREPESGQERVPDRWRLDLPAATEVAFSLGAGMQAELVREGDPAAAAPEAKAVVAAFGTGRPSKVSLEAGRYRLEVRSERENNRATYSLAAFPEALLPGMDREVRAPAEVPLAVGAGGLVEVSSLGSADVKARLYDAAGAFLAASDDRPDDWNFQLAAHLPPGRYLLRVDPVGAAAGSTTVRLRAPREIEMSGLALPASVRARPGRGSLLFPLAAVPGDLLLAQARGAESLGLSLEARAGGSWITLASTNGRNPRLEVPLAEETRRAGLRLRLWSEDRRDAPATLSVVGVEATRARESDLRRGLRLAPVPGLPPGTSAAVVELDGPGLFRVTESAGVRFGAESDAALYPAANGLVPAAAARLFVVQDAPGLVRAERVRLAAGDRLMMPVPARGVAPVEPAPSPGPLVVRARSRSLQPGLRLGESGDSRLAPSGAMAVAPGLAVAVALRPKKPLVLVFAATPLAPGPGTLGEATLEVVSLPRPVDGTLVVGAMDGSLEGRTAATYRLPPGAKRLRIGLSRDLVAAVSTGDTVESVLAVDEDSASETLYSSADTLTVLHTGAGEGRFSIETVAADAPRLTAREPFERVFAEAGLLRLAVADASSAPGSVRPPSTLRLRGAALDASFVSPNGSVQQGRDFTVAGSGTLLVRHRPGPFVAWLEPANGDPRAQWDLPGLPARKAVLPSTLAFEGEGLRLAFEPREPTLVQLRSATPLVTVWNRLQGPAEVEVHTEATSLDALLPAGPSELLLRPARGRSLDGTAELFATGVQAIGEGLGPEVLLAPGSSRAFSFEVRSGGPIGVGVRASAETAEATLLDAAGGRLGQGVAQMPTLAPGRYVLVVHAAADGPTVRARPAVAGLAQASVDPPLEVVRRYFEPESAPLTFSSRYVEEGAEIDRGSEGNEPAGEGEETFDEGMEEEVPEDPPPTDGAATGGVR